MFKIKDAWQIVEAPPSDEGTWVDARDGQVYTWKKLGNQTWMTQNFNYGGKSGDWVNTPNAQSEGHAYRYQNQQDYGNYEAQGWTFGAYYTVASLEWAVPDGWHVPTRDEINTLKTWAMETYGSGASGNVTAQMLGNAALMNSCSGLWSSYGLKVPANKHNLTGFNLCINSTGWSGSSWGGISTPGGYNFTNSSNLWLADANGTSQYYLIISEDSQYSYSGPNITISYGAPESKARPIRLIKDAEVSTTQPIITNITTTLDSTGSDNKIATEKATRSAITSAVSSKMSNPMTAAGDIIVGGTSGAPSRLATGTTGQVLKVGASGLEWANESGGGAVQSVSDTNSIDLSLDGNGDLSADLKIDTSTPGNVQLSVSSNGLKGSFDETVKALSGDNPVVVDYNSSDEYTVSLAVSRKAGNKVEIVDDQGQDSPGIYVPTPELDGIITTEGDLIVGGASGVPEALSAGAEGKVLKITSGVPAWGDDIGFANPMNDGGQMISGALNGTPTAISAPSAGQILIGFYAPGAYYVTPQWHNANESIIWGMPWTTKGSLVYAGGPYTYIEDRFLSGKNKLESLPIGTQGQVLAVNSSAVPAWTDPEIPSIENYSLSLTDSVQESASENENKVHFSKVYCYTSKKVSRMGFFHKSGTQGVVGMGIYNTSGSALVTTAVTGLTSATEGSVCWIDLLGPVTLTRGTVYWFALFTGWASGEWNTNIQFARNTSINGVGNTMIITYLLGSGTTSMPSSITTTTEGQFAPWIVAD